MRNRWPSRDAGDGASNEPDRTENEPARQPTKNAINPAVDTVGERRSGEQCKRHGSNK